MDERELSTLSYARGAAEPLLEETIWQRFHATVERYPERLALVVRHQNIRYTWRELGREVERTARGLNGIGLNAGDRVGVWASNCVEWILLQMATARLGIVLVNMNPAYRSHELSFVLRRSGMRALFLHARDARADYRAILAESRAGQKLPLEHVVWLGESGWDEMLASRRLSGAGLRPSRGHRQHSIHQRHYRLAQRRAAHASEPAQRRQRHQPLPAGHRVRLHLCSRASLSLLRIGDRVAGVRSHGSRAGAAFGAVRRPRHAGGGGS